MSTSRDSCCLPSVGRNMTSKFLRSMYNKTIIRFGFCDIQNNQGLCKGYQPQPSADNSYLGLDYSGYHKNLDHPIIAAQRVTVCENRPSKSRFAFLRLLRDE